MRIVAGDFRGRRLHAPKGDRIRPTTDKVREAVFSIVAPYVEDARVLDLYAGTGALGLESLSRGASFAVFVDQGSDALRLIRENIELCGAQDRTRVIQGGVQQTITRLTQGGELFDLIFMDPPYGKGLIERALLELSGVARCDALVVAEHHVKDLVPLQVKDWRRSRQRRYGDTVISFYINEYSC